MTHPSLPSATVQSNPCLKTPEIRPLMKLTNLTHYLCPPDHLCQNFETTLTPVLNSGFNHGMMPSRCSLGCATFNLGRVFAGNNFRALDDDSRGVFVTLTGLQKKAGREADVTVPREGLRVSLARRQLRERCGGHIS